MPDRELDRRINAFRPDLADACRHEAEAAVVPGARLVPGHMVFEVTAAALAFMAACVAVAISAANDFGTMVTLRVQSSVL